jgi:tripartite-type tricarboxylate transporter receptor subunit TctC
MSDDVKTVKCRRPTCGHTWIPRQHGKPRECPRCQSPRWDEAWPDSPHIDIDPVEGEERFIGIARAFYRSPRTSDEVRAFIERAMSQHAESKTRKRRRA